MFLLHFPPLLWYLHVDSSTDASGIDCLQTTVLPQIEGKEHKLHDVRMLFDVLPHPLLLRVSQFLSVNLTSPPQSPACKRRATTQRGFRSPALAVAAAYLV